jgi:hypothetical protein
MEAAAILFGEIMSPTFTFRMPSPQYRRRLDFIATHEKMTPGKVLSKFIHDYAHDVMDKQASLKAHEELVMHSGIPFDSVSWVRGAHTQDWQNLASAIGEEKAVEYREKFMPIWSRVAYIIDECNELGCFVENREII